MVRIKPDDWPGLIEHTILVTALTIVYLAAYDKLEGGRSAAAHVAFWLALLTCSITTVLRSARANRQPPR
jgi:hypothetical protein